MKAVSVFMGTVAKHFLTRFQIELKSCDHMMDKWEQVCPAVLPYQDIFILCSETESQQSTGSK